MRLRSVLVSIITLLGITVSLPQANAAVGDDWAFAYNNHLAPIGGFTPTDPARQWSKNGGPSAEVRSPGVGQYEVLFPKTVIKRGIVHVTAERQTPGWCQVEGWKNDTDGLHVFILCFKHGGTPDNSRFAVMATESSAGIVVPAFPVHAYVFSDATGTLLSTFNSSGFTNSVGWGGPGSGLYKVELPMRGTEKPNGNFQVTAVGSKAARCKIADWAPTNSGQNVLVACFDGSSKPFDTAWTLSYNRELPLIGESGPPKRFGYVWATPTLPPLTNFNSAGAANTVFFGTGQYLVTFKTIGLHEDHMQVTAFGKGPAYCILGNVWFSHGDSTIRNVECYDEFGTLTKHEPFVAYTSRH
ncbi:hypothetical protein LWC34_25730 [Kibdelosporangium philippinense]|uniref:Uncharacterized protein n=1 Tax=Kibdelosporangium philippinense TaxID=211113 RepID=A0ABS8ZID9_9PSEU|nr:hypothetical protein [Kibdelosporangium philippinense]MCE7006213.1 hypothetical protein [Kibdelosporangium philippinense]